MTALNCDNCDWFDRDEICDECRKRHSTHRLTVKDKDQEENNHDRY